MGGDQRGEKKGAYHEPKDMQEGPNKQDVPRPKVVVQFTDDGSAEEHEERLEGYNPRDSRGGVGRKEVSLIELLEDADCWALGSVQPIYVQNDALRSNR